jgi:MarR family 2-MHQ and catechol resistance regulon transcriptional repressor
MDPHPPRAAADRREAYYGDVCSRVRSIPDADPSAANLIVHLLYAHDVIQTRMARYLSAHSLSPSAFNVLMILRNNESAGGEDAMALHHISELLLVSRANVTGLVDCLLGRGLVERRIDERDRRVRLASLTDEGRALLEEILPGHHAQLREMCRGVDPEERRILTRLLARLRKSAEEASAP